MALFCAAIRRDYSFGTWNPEVFNVFALPGVNVMDFEFGYYVAVLHVSHYSTGSLPLAGAAEMLNQTLRQTKKINAA